MKYNEYFASWTCCSVDAIELLTKTANLIIGSIYIIPLGDIEFLKRLDVILKYLYSPKSEFITCSDININYLNENN
jgi:hypothetical protein